MAADVPALTPEQIAAFHRAAATLKDEDFSPEDMAGIRKGWLQLTKDRAYSGPGVHYEMPPLNGVQRGSLRLGLDIIKKLGHGDIRAGAAVAAGMFSIEPGDDPTIVRPDVIRDVGHGDMKAGRRILQKFIARVRAGARGGVTLHYIGRQHADDHGWRVR